MTKVNSETIKHLTRLCRIDCSEEEQTVLLKDLSNIIAYMDQLSELDTTSISPCTHVIEGMVNVMRDDTVGPVLPRDLFLSNIPNKSYIAGMVKIPSVFKS